MLSGHEKTLRDRTITLGILTIGLFAILWTIVAVRGAQRVFVIDPLGGVVQGPLEPLSSSRGYFTITSINAVQAAFQRSAAGFDLPEMVPLYYSAKARRTLDDDTSRRTEDFRRRHLTTKPVIESITPPEPAGNGRIVRVTGRLQCTGAVNGRVFYEEPGYEMLLVFRPNSDLGNKAALPWVVDEVDLALGDQEIEGLRAKNRLK
ncbi:hypothetical protein DB347_17520 [Opitutaceae bacterium EW11]|nr:hypothetical protein DB347_17520 [Opitutaceae bacterium EW11]